MGIGTFQLLGSFQHSYFKLPLSLGLHGKTLKIMAAADTQQSKQQQQGYQSGPAHQQYTAYGAVYL
ncbi:hypothetical protein AO738_28130 [Pseudomonas citronellolis]|nr:hypothetical protein AO742_04220 [Pseudomonas citronellolis]KRW79333.1 hypothetical protein AO738_28130 [Pseudomonas citronellolis]